LADYFDVLEPSHVEPPARSSWNHAEAFRAGALSAVTRETRHVHGKPSTSIEFALPGAGSRVAWWSGDSVVDADLLQRLAPRTSVFFHDCTFAEFPGQVHDDTIEEHRERAVALGFRLALPGDVYDLCSGDRLEAG
jgi:hypothetical protein